MWDGTGFFMHRGQVAARDSGKGLVLFGVTGVWISVINHLGYLPNCIG